MSNASSQAPGFSAVVRALSKERGVTFGGKGFDRPSVKLTSQVFS